MSEIVLYTDSVEYLYASVTAFEVDGVATDPTTFTAELALVETEGELQESDWVAAEWVDVSGTDRVRVLAGDEPALTAGRYIVYVRLTDATEVIIRQAGRLTVKAA